MGYSYKAYFEQQDAVETRKHKVGAGFAIAIFLAIVSAFILLLPIIPHLAF